VCAHVHAYVFGMCVHLEECSLPLSLHENRELPDTVVFAQPLLLAF